MLEALIDQVLTGATSGLVQRVESARELATVLPGLLHFTTTAGLSDRFDAARDAIDALPVLPGRPSADAATSEVVAWMQAARQAFGALSGLRAVARSLAAEAAASRTCCRRRPGCQSPPTRQPGSSIGCRPRPRSCEAGSRPGGRRARPI